MNGLKIATYKAFITHTYQSKLLICLNISELVIDPAMVYISMLRMAWDSTFNNVVAGIAICSLM